MAKFVFLFRGGNVPEELRAKNNDDWRAWITDLSDRDAFVDIGAPLAEGKVVSLSNGTRDFSWDGDSGVGGYSIVKASNMDEAIMLTESCPQLSEEYGGGTVEVREFIEVAM